ncbi:hypothetical protein PR048_019637 [Dryococelus australis]|uniref:DUF4371 domain-containing protein n=1 Tax=Dryococelus australis TaxID=614101 RepID=A0ABQ9H408_9NEOP|nr:hypothetical protein PR048_019637 [Dryococelus australis]
MQWQRSTFFKATHAQKSYVQASYKVCTIMAKNQMSFRSSKIIKQCAIKIVKSFGDDKVAKNVATVSLSHQTVSRRTPEISKQLEAQLSKEIAQSKYFFVTLDESTDITDTVDELFSIKELLDVEPLPTSAKGSDIYSALVSVIEKYSGFSKCLCTVTYGAKCITGKNTGIVGLLRKK